MPGFLKSVDKPVVIAFGFIVVLLLAGSLYSSSFLSANYLLQQLQVERVDPRVPGPGDVETAAADALAKVDHPLAVGREGVGPEE